MKRLLVVAASIVVLAAGGAFAGEVKGPPGTLNNTNETGAPTHANSACAFSGLNDYDLSDHEGQLVNPGSDRGGLLEVLRASAGRPRQIGLCKGGTGLGSRVVDKIPWLAPFRSGPTLGLPEPEFH